MFAGDDDLLNLIQTEAITLVDSILEESVTVVNNNSSPFNPSSFEQDYERFQPDGQQLSQQDSQDDNSFDNYDQSPPQQPSQLPLIHVNHYSVNPQNSFDMAHSDEISDNFAIKSDFDIIVKSPTIESMSGKSFEDVDDEYVYNSSTFNDVNVDSNLNENNNTATNITPSSSFISTQVQKKIENIDSQTSNIVDSILEKGISNREDLIQVEAQSLVDSVLQETVANLEGSKLVSDKQTVAFLDDDSKENADIVRNISEHKLHRVERKFEHLSSEVHDDSPEELLYSDQIDNLINKDDISMLQNEFSKISWDESLSATTGEYGSSTPDNDLQDVLTNAGDTYRHQHNK